MSVRICEDIAASPVSIEKAHWLSVRLAVALDRWHRRVFPRPNLSVTDPVSHLVALRGQLLISKKQYRGAIKWFKNPDAIVPDLAEQLKELLLEAQKQAIAKHRRLSSNERRKIASMVNRGNSLGEIAEHFGILVSGDGEGRSRDISQAEEWVASQPGGNHAKATE